MSLFECPKCGSDNIEVQISTWAKLIQSDDNVETDAYDSHNGDHEWDGDSQMYCCECDHRGKASTFSTDTLEEDEEDKCRKCGESAPAGGDGWDGLCGNCADKAEKAEATCPLLSVPEMKAKGYL